MQTGNRKHTYIYISQKNISVVPKNQCGTLSLSTTMPCPDRCKPIYFTSQTPKLFKLPSYIVWNKLYEY